MKKKYRYLLIFFLFLIIPLIALLRVNRTLSIPTGIYIVTGGKYNIEKDSYVTIDTNKSEIFELGIQRNYIKLMWSGTRIPLMKKVVGLPGDTVYIDSEGVFVNGIFIPNSKPLKRDSKGLPLYHTNMNKKLGPTEYIVVGESSDSFDSRYFGVVQGEDIGHTIRRIYTFTRIGENLQ